MNPPDGSRGQTLPLSQTPRALWVLLGLNLLVFVLWNSWGRSPQGWFFMQLHFVHATEALHRFWTLLTSSFSHHDAGHLFFNMFALWVFGRSVAQAIGQRGLVHLYLVGGVVASLASQALAAITGQPSAGLGASGAVMAIAVAYAALFPRRKLYLNFLVPVPAWLAVAGYVLLDVFGLFDPHSEIGHMAHLGGALYGLLYWLTAIRAKDGRRSRGK